MKLYVGTYAAYNRGLLRGAWLDLDKFANKDEFLKACRRLHKGERNPEFMFQDVEFTTGEDWERNYYDESHIDAGYWKEAAEARARRESEAKNPKKSDPIREEYIAALIAEGLTPERAAAHSKDVDVVVKLTGGQFIEIEKPSIETSHCEGEDEGYGGPTVAEAQSRCNYFKTLEGFKAVNFDKIRDFKDVNREEYFLIPSFMCYRFFKPECAKVYNIARPYRYDNHAYDRAISVEDWQRIDKGFEVARKNLEKRLDAYWKRYGASKLRTWTYWMSA